MYETIILLNSLSGGGAEKAMKLLANRLSSDQKVLVIGINSSLPDYISYDFDTVELKRKPRANLLQTLKSIVNFIMLMNRLQAKTLIVNCALSELFAIFSRGMRQIILVEHANPAWEGRSVIGRFVRKLLLRKTNLVIAVSSHLNLSHSNRSIDLVIPNLIDLNHLLVGYSTKEYSLSNSLEVIDSITYIGRLSNPEKRPQIALELARLTGLDVNFYGLGPMRQFLEREATRLCIKAKFMGFHPNPWDEISQNSLICIPSRNEGDGLVAVEAILLGRPLVVSDIADFQRFGLSPESYFTDVSKLAQSIQLNPKLSRFLPPESSRQSLIEERNIEKIVQKWKKLILGV